MYVTRGFLDPGDRTGNKTDTGWLSRLSCYYVEHSYLWVKKMKKNKYQKFHML